MIVISTYNPNTPRSTEDEEHLTTLLASLIRYRSMSLSAKQTSPNQSEWTYHETQIRNCDVLIASVFPLLGLSFTEVLDLVNKGDD